MKKAPVSFAPQMLRVKKGCGQRKSRRDAAGRAHHLAVIAQPKP